MPGATILSPVEVTINTEYFENLIYLLLTKTFAENHQLDHVFVQARQVTTRIVANKMISVFGDYPTTKQKEAVSKLLGKRFGLLPTAFYGRASHEGFLARALENARRTWESKKTVYSL